MVDILIPYYKEYIKTLLNQPPPPTADKEKFRQWGIQCAKAFNHMFSSEGYVIDTDVPTLLDEAEKILETCASDEWLEWGAVILRARARRLDQAQRNPPATLKQDVSVTGPVHLLGDPDKPEDVVQKTAREVATRQRERKLAMDARNKAIVNRFIRGEITKKELRALTLKPLDGFDDTVPGSQLSPTPRTHTPSHASPSYSRSPLSSYSSPKLSSSPSPSSSPQSKPPNRSVDRKGKGPATVPHQGSSVRKRVVYETDEAEDSERKPKRKRGKIPKNLPQGAVRASTACVRCSGFATPFQCFLYPGTVRCVKCASDHQFCHGAILAATATSEREPSRAPRLRKVTSKVPTLVVVAPSKAANVPSKSVAGPSRLKPAFEERMIAGPSNRVESPPDMDASEDLHETPPPMDDDVEEYIAQFVSDKRQRSRSVSSIKREIKMMRRCLDYNLEEFLALKVERDAMKIRKKKLEAQSEEVINEDGNEAARAAGQSRTSSVTPPTSKLDSDPAP
ncbi:hypothetical protein HETIRDRAFT_450381 [Heterobasidion irregulare TC 32-1]|uniref:Uncharacterized protein n=1 Tax=Heterobasidion irregulare (strain TC 32-1) TaxID=747525 RepID=W4KBU3_HETIT|nr:uncharacterized protein HETIRDRAFT_450381 [Heterobasidion irregulare TC 32-1]ETW82546.1 hypothetical protein HETIRDRAFT_450381 [Heterobasidion irregulare TC 32-1]